MAIDEIEAACKATSFYSLTAMEFQKAMSSRWRATTDAMIVVGQEPHNRNLQTSQALLKGHGQGTNLLTRNDPVYQKTTIMFNSV